MKRNLVLFILVLMTLTIFSGCGKKQVQQKLTEPVDMEMQVRKVSEGYLSNQSPLVIMLYDNEYAVGKKGEEVTNLIIDLQPKAKGKAVWQDKQTLHFIPEKEFKKDQLYKVTVYPSNISLDDAFLTPLLFSFRAIGREVTELKLDVYVDENDNKLFWVQGSVEFSQPVELAILTSAAKLEFTGKVIPVNWKMETNQKYTFTSEKLTKEEDAEGKINFRLDAGKLELSKDIVREIEVKDIDKFNIRSVKTDIEDDFPSVEVTFSELASTDQDFKGLITSIPAVVMEIDLRQELLIISGDFQPGLEYRLTFSKEIKSVTGKKLFTDSVQSVNFTDKKPELKFSDDAVFITGNENDKIYFRTMNLSKVKYKVTRIFENNLCQFLQHNELSMRENNWGFGNLNYVGKEVAKGELEIGETRNQWLQHELDISLLLPENEFGIFIVELTMNKTNSLYRANPLIAANYGWGQNPLEDNYYYYNGSIVKPVILTNLGVTYKLAGQKSWCYVTDLDTAKPVWGAEVKLYTLQNQLLTSSETGLDGSCVLEHAEDPFFVTASFKGRQSIVKLQNDRWETSRFDTQGINAGSDELKAFFYTERGVYRPGDDINVMIVLRNKSGSFPDRHPVNVRLMDPRGNTTLLTTLKEGVGGVYHLPLQMAPDDPTGTWKLKIYAGKAFYHDLKVETVAPERLKLSFEPQADSIAWDVESFNIVLEAKYLFGRAAAGLKANMKYRMDAYNKRFTQPRWRDFSFTDVTFSGRKAPEKKVSATLDENGKTTVTWQREKDRVPSAGILHLTADVIDKGGRASTKEINVLWEPWQAYVGINSSSSYLQRNKENELEIVLLDNNGNLLSGEELNLKIYENSHYWWWEYNNRSDFMQHFKTMPATRLLQEHKLISTSEPILHVLPHITGHNVLIEVTHLTPDGEKHTSSRYLYTRYWGDRDSRTSASIMELASDKKEYYANDTAHIYFPTTPAARNLITLEKNDQILDWWWFEAGKDAEKADFEIKLNADMTPGVYATVSVIQPHQETDNDCPLRMYGIIPLIVVDASTKENLVLTVPEILRPSEKFTCTLQAKPDAKTQFTIAVVDEGLLSLTNFASPDPWKYFYGKERLNVSTYDCFDKVSSLNNGLINKRFSVGGDIMMELGASVNDRQLEKTDVKRFIPVCLFSGIQRADAKGKVKVEFDMPDYLGAVRIMAVSVNGSRYGHTDKTVTVRKELMLLPTLPRALAPADTFIVPVEVFSFVPDIKEATVTLKAEGPLVFSSGNRQNVTLNERGEGTLYFQAAVQDELKAVSVKAEVNSGNYNHHSLINIPVRPLQPYQMVTQKVNIEPGATVPMNIPRDGLKGTEKFTLQLIRSGYFDYNKHLSYLIRYPYGCLEQKVSAAFPQLFIGSIIKPEISIQIMGDIDRNIDAAIAEIGRHQLGDGSFSYWRGEPGINLWACVYAAHFLLEAAQKGYYVPEDTNNLMFRYLRDYRFGTDDYKVGGNYKTAIYRLYVLAKAGTPENNTMNYLAENHLEKLDNADRWLLAGAYKAAGQPDLAASVLKFAGWDVPLTNNNYWHNFSSVNRDRAIILAMATEGGLDQQVDKLYNLLADELNENTWYSTQTRAFMLWALSSYINKHPEMVTRDKVMGSLKTAAGDNIVLNISEDDWFTSLSDCENISVYLADNSAPARFQLCYDRVPAKPVTRKDNDFFNVSRTLKTSTGSVIDSEKLQQGETYTLEIKVKRLKQTNIEHLALTQILPSGWEIVNDRLSGTYDNVRNDATYTDIRDDRILWFFSGNKYDKNDRTFSTRIRAVTAGTFEIPPTIMEAMYSPDYTVILPGGRTKISR
ncbi:MAG: hypothetical protein K9N06_03930 [Candidatus Cloacimonetes bacterium]|nr:hypothetical protein [Candidatus Cloacimonadota bacterium]